MRESISISLPEEIRADLDRFSKARGITVAPSAFWALEAGLEPGSGI